MSEEPNTEQTDEVEAHGTHKISQTQEPAAEGEGDEVEAHMLGHRNDGPRNDGPRND